MGCYGGQGYLEKGYGDVRWERPPFSRSLSRSTRSPFQHFSVPQDPHFNQKSQNFPIFYSKCLNLLNFQLLNLNIRQNPVQEASFRLKISSESSIFVKKKKKKKKISSAGPQIWCRSILSSPYFRCSTLDIPAPPKIGYPPRMSSLSYHRKQTGNPLMLQLKLGQRQGLISAKKV